MDCSCSMRDNQTMVGDLRMKVWSSSERCHFANKKRYNIHYKQYTQYISLMVFLKKIEEKTTYHMCCRKTWGSSHSGHSWHTRDIHLRKTQQGSGAGNPWVAPNVRLEGMSPSWNKKTGLKISRPNFSAKTFPKLEIFCCCSGLFVFFWLWGA